MNHPAPFQADVGADAEQAKLLIGYARVSTDDQNLYLEMDALNKWLRPTTKARQYLDRLRRSGGCAASCPHFTPK